MSYQTYLTANQALSEKELAIEWLSIQEALTKKMTLPEFFNASQLSEAELNEPGIVAFMKDGFGLAITLNQDAHLTQVFQQNYVYDVQLIADDQQQIKAVYQQLVDYLKTQLVAVTSASLWEVLEGEDVSVSTKKLAVKELTSTVLADFFAEDDPKTSRRLDFSQN